MSQGQNHFTKQPVETFYVGAEFSQNLDTGETIVLAGSTVTAEDSNGNDVTSTVIESGTTAVATATAAEVDNEYTPKTSGMLEARVKAGTAGETYKLTFRGLTSAANKFELDVRMKVKQL